MDLPYMKFYVRDWLSDTELRMASLAARGFWMECLCLMHGAKRRGYLETPNGNPIKAEELERLTGTFKGDLKGVQDELLRHGIPSVEDQTGIWYCRRMVKEAAKAAKCADAGRRGGGNPALNSSSSESRNQKPETRDHISLKATFKGNKNSSERSTIRSKPPVLKPDQVFISIPVTGSKDGNQEYPLSHDQVAEWEQLFPAVDVRQTLREIRAWNMANPKRRKTTSGVVRHVASWLTKEQNKG